MNFKELTVWVEAHPGESILIGGGGLILLLWLLGAFSSKQATDSGASSLAAAYYAAEAQQAVVGGQIQEATIGAARDTAIAGLQANAAVAINSADTGAATTINGQNASAATTINAANNAASTTQTGLMAGVATIASNNQLLATYANNATAQYVTASNNMAATQQNMDSANATLFASFIHDFAAPSELAGGSPPVNLTGVGGAELAIHSSGPIGGSPGWYAAQGYSPEQIANIFGSGIHFPATVT
jgi:hypothetical protein